MMNKKLEFRLCEEKTSNPVFRLTTCQQSTLYESESLRVGGPALRMKIIARSCRVRLHLLEDLVAQPGTVFTEQVRLTVPLVRARHAHVSFIGV